MPADDLRISISGTELRHFTLAGAVPGVVPLLAAGLCSPGTGRLRYSAAGLAWRAPCDDDWGADVAVSADGQYCLPSATADAFLRVQVVAAFLVVGSESLVTLRDVYGAWLDDVLTAEAAAGATDYVTLTLTNAGSTTLQRVRAWLGDATADLAISADAAAWYTATTEEAGCLVGDLAASATAPLYVRRTIAAAAPADPRILAVIHLAFDEAVS